MKTEINQAAQSEFSKKLAKTLNQFPKAAQFPYGFPAYAKVASKCIGKKLCKHAMYLGEKA